MKALAILGAAAILAGFYPAWASPSIRQYYQAPVPPPYPSLNRNDNPYRPPPPQPQETLPRQVTPSGSPRIRMEPN